MKPKRKKSRPLEEHSDAEVLTLVAWGHTRINVLKSEIKAIEKDVKKWRGELRKRKK
jgi:hypothetical protein